MTETYFPMSERWTTFLMHQGAVIEDGRVVVFREVSPAEHVATMEKPVDMCDLSHESQICIAGDDAIAFTQAQFTNDVASLPANGAQWNGWCSPKGRLLTTFLLWRDDSHARVLLQLPSALQAGIKKRLQMFVLRSKVTLSDALPEQVRLGVMGPNAGTWVQRFLHLSPPMPMTAARTDDVEVIALAGTRFQIMLPVEQAIALWQAAMQAGSARQVAATHWDRAGIDAGIITVHPATQDAFVPQMANFELIGGVSFKKGCYPGQEIVARTQYRGILKRRMALVRSANSLAVGESVFAPEFGDQAVGQVANAAPGDGNDCVALVVAQIESICANALRVGSATGERLEVIPLPYAVPEFIQTP